MHVHCYWTFGHADRHRAVDFWHGSHPNSTHGSLPQNNFRRLKVLSHCAFESSGNFMACCDSANSRDICNSRTSFENSHSIGQMNYHHSAFARWPYNEQLFTQNYAVFIHFRSQLIFKIHFRRVLVARNSWSHPVKRTGQRMLYLEAISVVEWNDLDLMNDFREAWLLH